MSKEIGGEMAAFEVFLDRYKTGKPYWSTARTEICRDFWQAALAHKSEGAAPTDGFVDVVFDGPPGPTSGRFIEVENDKGFSINFGEWVHRPDGYWALRFAAPAAPIAVPADASYVNTHSVGREIFRVMKPVGMTNADWDSRAVLGANNEFRKQIMLAAERVIGLCVAPAPHSGEAATGAADAEIRALIVRLSDTARHSGTQGDRDAAKEAVRMLAQLGDAIVAQAAQGTEIRHVGGSRFESWYSDYNVHGAIPKQIARDAYTAGMGDQTVATIGEAGGVVAEPVSQRFELTRSIIHKYPALKLPQSYLQKLGMTAQILLLYDLPQAKCEQLVDCLNAGDKSSEYWLDRLNGYGRSFISQLDRELSGRPVLCAQAIPAAQPQAAPSDEQICAIGAAAAFCERSGHRIIAKHMRDFLGAVEQIVPQAAPSELSEWDRKCLEFVANYMTDEGFSKEADVIRKLAAASATGSGA